VLDELGDVVALNLVQVAIASPQKAYGAERTEFWRSREAEGEVSTKSAAERRYRLISHGALPMNRM
jgi:hypothetical protein